VLLTKNRFTEVFLRANRLDPADFQHWAFLPGMRFGSMAKWWGDCGQRDFPHEGVDLCLYEDRRGEVRRLDETTHIPVMAAGTVQAIFKDYLGQAVIVEHGSAADREGADRESRYLSVYAHTRPRNDLRPGDVIGAGEVIATIADTRRSKAKILPHLHLSLSIPAPDLVYENFVWNIMRDPDRVTLTDPMYFIDGPWRALDPTDCDDLRTR